MKKKIKRGSKKLLDQNIRFRKKYKDHSRRFQEFVQSFGLEKTFFGKWLDAINQRVDIRRLSLLYLFCLFLSILLFFEFDFVYKVSSGDVVSSEVKSPITFDFIDEDATEEKRIEAENEALSVFDYDSEVYEKLYNRIYSSFRKMRQMVRRVHWPTRLRLKEEKVKDFLQNNKQIFEKDLGVSVSNRIFEWMVEERFSVSIENTVRRALVKWSTHEIFEAPGEQDYEKVIARHLDFTGKAGDEFAISKKNLRDNKNKKLFDLEGVRGAKSLSSKDRRNVLTLARSLITPSLTYNHQETAQRKKSARDSVLPVQISVKKGQTILTSGSVVTRQQVQILKEIRHLKSHRRIELMTLAASMLFVVLVLVFFSYLRRFTRKKILIENKDITIMGVVTLLVVFISKIFLFMTDAAFLAKFGSIVPASVFLFATPITAGPMLVGLLITSGEVVWLFSAFLSLSLSLMVDNNNFPFLVVAIIGSIAAARGVYTCKKRNDIYWAGLRTGLINAITILCLLLVRQSETESLWTQIVWNLPAGFIGGVLASFIAMMLIPLLESIFNYTTDVKLLELSNLNHPLMKEMVVRAPGTYHHCLSVGTMVEEAATEIGANALLAKVMAYYHDIGKMEHAQYFIENQRPGFNPHEQISPYMSKTILVAHVKDGAEMGLDHKLGKPIIDGILQHHGTTLISYFYNKAKDNSIDYVEENQFRYPGPKPQFKEAALVMLADSIEAAARSIDESTGARLTHLVHNIIHTKFVDGQLDECDLTFKELSIIEKAFERSLLSIYHHRLDYPHMKFGAPVENKKNESNVKLLKKSNKKKSGLA